MPLPDQKTAEFDRGKLTYLDAGEGPTLVFLHGLAGASQSWLRQFEAFAGNHRVIAWDTPGYGGSDCVTSDADTFAAKLAELLDYLNISRINLTGHSMGGIVAGRFAGRYPGRVKTLVLSCTFVGGLQSAGLPLGAGYQSRLDDLNTQSAEQYGCERAPKMVPPGTPADIVDMIAGIAAGTTPAGLESAARMIQEADNRPLLEGLTMPVTVFEGELDPVVSADRTGELAAIIPGAKKVTLPKAGHAPYLEYPDDYNAAIRQAFSLS